MERLQFRARQEWDGLEIFDRINRQSFNVASGKDEMEWMGKNKEQTEPVINTSYPKSNLYCSAPKRIYWEITRDCNLNCANCFNRYGSIHEEMSFNQQCELAQTLYNNGVWIIQLTGGEPTIAPHVWDLASYLNEIGFYIAMGSHGIYNPETFEKMIHSPVDWMIISIDLEHAKQAGKMAQKNAISAKETVRALKQTKKRVSVNTIIQRGNYTYEHIQPLANFCAENQVDALNCLPLRTFTKDKAVLETQLTKFEFKDFISGIRRLREEYAHVKFITSIDLQFTSQDNVYVRKKSCAAGREGCVISPFGEVYGCSYSLASMPDSTHPERQRYVAGNLKERSFMDIWNDSTQWAMFRYLDKYKNPKCQSCSYYIGNKCFGNCPVMVEGEPEALDPYCYIDIL